MKKIVIIMLISLILPTACNTGRKTNAEKTSTADDGIDSTFQYKVDRFADIEILRYPVPGFNALSLQQKELIYYLSQAALEGRDILYDQHNKRQRDPVLMTQFLENHQLFSAVIYSE